MMKTLRSLALAAVLVTSTVAPASASDVEQDAPTSSFGVAVTASGAGGSLG